MADTNLFTTQYDPLAEANRTLSAYDMYMRTPNAVADLAGQPVVDTRTPFQRRQINYADTPSTDLVPGFVRSQDPMLLDPDAFGTKTAGWAKQNGLSASSDYIAGLNVFGRAMSRDQLQASEAGRQLLEIATKNRQGKKRGFLEAITDFEWGDLPFVGMIASVGGSIADAVTVSDTLRKLQDGEAVTDDELVKTRLYMAKQERDAEGSWGATVGSIVRAAPGFMVEMWASGGLAAAGRGAAVAATEGGIHLGLTRGTKILAREAVEDLTEKALAKQGAKSLADFAASAEGKAVTKSVATQLFGYMKSADAAHMYKGFSDDALQAMAENRAKYEMEKLVARRGGTALSNGFSTFTQWAGSHISRGLMDYGSWGTEEATKLFTRHSTAGRALADAMGVFTIEAPVKGAVLMLPKATVTEAVVAPLAGQDGRVVTDSQLALQTSALMTGNRALMENAESIATGINLLEYISENTGAGFKSLLAAGGIGLERLGMKGLVRPLATAISPTGTALPVDGADAYTIGGRLRKFMLDRFGTRDTFRKRMVGQEAQLVAERLGMTDAAGMSAVRQAVMSGNVSGLSAEARAQIGSDFAKFVRETVDQAYDRGQKDLLYKTHARYTVAKWMAEHQVGPETVMNVFNQMGYDGILGEMFEERYSDFAKGLFGLDDKAEHSFGANLKEAIKGLYPGWDQLTAEAVGFAFPMATRGLAMRAMSAIGGGGRLEELRARLGVIDDAMRHSTVGEMTYSEAQSAFEYARRQDENEVANLTSRLEAARAANDNVAVEALTKELATRQDVARRRAERQAKFFESVDEAAKSTAGALIAVPLDTYGTLSSEGLADRAPVLTEAEARQTLDAQKALGDFASSLARQLVEGQLPLEGESESGFRKVARRLIGIAGSIVTGDFSLAAYNPASWTARDMGLSRQVVDSLREGFRKELTTVRKEMPDNASTKDVLDETQRRFDLRARQIMASNLAIHQLRSFSDGRLREEAAAQWAATHVDEDGRSWNYTVDTEGRPMFYKLSEDGRSVDESSATSLEEMFRQHGDEIDKVKSDILKATVDVMTRRLTGSDAGRNTVLSAMTLSPGSDMLDVALYDAAMHMIGAQDLLYRVTLDGQTPLRAVMEARSVARVSDNVIDYIAAQARFDDVDKVAFESVAQSLRLRFDGTEEGLKARNEKIFRLAKLMRLNRKEGTLFFSKEILAEDADELRMSANGTSTLTAVRQDDGSYAVDFGAKKNAPKERDVRTFTDIEALRTAMAADGYLQDEAHTVLTQAKVIESSDMFWMIRELGLAKEYYERLGDRRSAQTHPMLRRGEDGGFLDQREAEAILAKELAAAMRGKTAAPGSVDRRMYDNLFGENGYMTVGEELLAERGIHKDALRPYTGEFHDYAPSRYTLLMSAGRISPKSADTYVTVDPSVNSDITSGVVNAILMNAYASNGRLLRDSLGNVISDFVADARRIAQAAIVRAQKDGDHELAEQLTWFVRICCDDVDRVVRRNGKTVVSRGTGLSSAGFTTLANAFGLFRATDDATNPMLRALATIAPEVWQSPSFLAFEGLLNTTLGGNALDAAIWEAKPGAKDMYDPSLTGVPQVMALATANVNALRNAVQASLPAGMGYEQFLDAVIQQLTAQSKTGRPAITEEEQAELRARARAAASAHADASQHFSFLGGLISTMKAAVDRKLTVSTSVADFLGEVLNAVANDPNATDAQRTAATKQLGYLRQRSVDASSETAYTQKVDELASVQEKLRASEAKVAELRQKLIDVERRAMAGEPVSDADRQAGQVELADATAELQGFLADFDRVREEATGMPTPPGLHALDLGGTTVEERDTVSEVATELEDDGDATIAHDPNGADVPEAFAREASKREDGFTARWGRPADDGGRRLTPRQAKLAAGLVVRSMVDDIDESSFLARLSQLLPHLIEGERQDILAGFRDLDAARLAAGRDWASVAVVGESFGFEEDEKSDEDRSSENFNERALAEYNSDALTDFTALLRRVAVETNGSIMGFVDVMRGRVRGWDATAPAYELLNGLLNPQLQPGLKSLAQADARHKDVLKRFSGADIPETVDALVKVDPQAAFLVVYLSGLPDNARTRFAGLCSGSVATTPVHSVDGLMSEKSSTPDGKISDTLIGDAFDSLLGKSSHQLQKIAKALRDASKGDTSVSAYRKGDDSLETLRENAAKVAELLAESFGRNNPLYIALTSHVAHRAWARAGREMRRSLLESVSRTERGIDALNTIASAVESLASRGRELTRTDIESTFVAAFMMGGFDNTGLLRAPSRIDITDPLMSFLNEFEAAMPRTMMRSEIDSSREQTASTVVVAPRGMVPLLSRWLYQEGEGSFTEICRQAWPDVTDELLAECRQDGTWPDDARTPVCAKCISSSLTPTEVYDACDLAFQAAPGKTSWVPLYSGDHSSFTMIQVPPAVRFGAKDYEVFAKAAYKAVGMDLMFTDTKRSAISSLEAQGTGLVGVDAQGNYGEHRVHILHNWNYDDPKYVFRTATREADKNAAFLGSTFMFGYGADAIGNMSADPESNTKKVHIVGGAGRDLFFIKSLTVSQGNRRGSFREGSAPRAVFDYAEKFRGSDTLSTDTFTDDDSYKIGPGNSKGLRVVNGGKDSTVMSYVFGRLVQSLVESGELPAQYDRDQLAKAFKKYNKMTGDELDAAIGPLTVKDNARGVTSEMKLSEIMPGAMVNVFEGWSGPSLDLSYREDSAMAYTVANVAHRSNVPAEPGRSPRNYEIDALAMVRTLADGGWLTAPQAADGFKRLLANWGILASATYTHPGFRKALVRMNDTLADLIRNGEFVTSDGTFSGQFAVEEMTRQMMAKTRQAANLPLQGIDAPLVAAGASLDATGQLIVHTTSRMEAAMLKGSELFSDEERAFYGTNRRLALCNVNVSNNGFRYGWFLAKDAEAKNPNAYVMARATDRAGKNPARLHAVAIAWAAQQVRDLTRRVDENPQDQQAVDGLKTARKSFASMFVDHHGTSIADYGDRYLSTYSVEDLFVSADDSESFDYSAVQCEGQDLVYNDATGEEHVFLGGTMFGLPRTPSYNGSMWLQTVRAGLPVTEREIEDAPQGTRAWLPGEDAMVSPDPYTNAILGCDHDGDKAKLYMFSVNAKGAVRYANLPECPRNEKDPRRTYLAQCATDGYLERLRISDTGDETVVDIADDTPDTYLRISNIARKRVSNSFVRSLFTLARQLPVDGVVEDRYTVRSVRRPAPGATDNAPRAKFIDGIASSPTKAFPTGSKKALLKEGLPEVIRPDGSNGTLGDPRLAMAIATSAMDAGDARGVMVSLARTLHMAWALGSFSGDFERNTDLASLLGPISGQQWLRFMYHVDGLSNATFDDIKEQVCGRLGWTRGMMDSVITELIMYPERLPVTDIQFEEILKSYASNIRRHGPRYWMLRNSSRDDGEIHDLITHSFLLGDRWSKSAFMESVGVEEVRDGDRRVLETVPSDTKTLGAIVGKAICDNGGITLLDMLTRDSGRNSAMGLLYSAVVHGLHGVEGLNAMEARKVGDLSAWRLKMGTVLKDDQVEKVRKAMSLAFEGMKVAQWTARRSLLTRARSIEQSLNYLTADPGAPNAQATAQRIGETYTNFRKALAGKPSLSGAVSAADLSRMHNATMWMYEVGQDLATVAARAVRAAQNREVLLDRANAFYADNREVVGRLLAKDTIGAYDLLRLQYNQQQVPYLAAFFSGLVDDVLAGIPMAKGERLSGTMVYGLMKSMAGRIQEAQAASGPASGLDVEVAKARRAFVMAKPGPEKIKAQTQLNQLLIRQRQQTQVTGSRNFTPAPIAARLAVESLMSIAYELMVTSTEFASDEMNRAAVFVRSAPDTAFTGGKTDYGAAAAELRRLAPAFRANDQMSLDKVREMFDRVIRGQAFAGKRFVATSKGRLDGGSFVLSRAALLRYVGEFSKTSPKTLEDIKRVPMDKRRLQTIERAWQALGDEEVTPAVLFGALLPAYTLMTSRMAGAPSAASTSLLSCLPSAYYSALSSGEATLRRISEQAPCLPLMVGTNWETETYRPNAEDKVVPQDSYDIADQPADDQTRNKLRGGAGRREYRRNPGNRNLVDVFDPAFEAALGVVRSSVPVAPAQPREAREAHGKYDKDVAKIALAFGSLLGSWASVEYNGGTVFTIRGNLRGDAGTGKAVSIVVDVSANPLLESNDDVERLADSVAYATSLTAAVDLGISASQFMSLPRDVRRALVRKYGLGGATSSQVAWSVNAKGLATLAGRISLSTASGTKAYHEYFHSMMRMFESFGLFGEEDYRQLAATFGEDPSGRHRFNEERAAESFRKWVEGNTDHAADEVRGVFRRILDFLKGLLAALKQGFSYGDRGGEETLFRMMVHGIAQPSSARLSEAQLESASAAGAIRREFAMARTPKTPRSALEANAAKQVVGVAPRAARLDYEEQPEAATALTEDIEKRSAQLAGKIVKMIEDPESNAASLAIRLQRLAGVRAEMAQLLGLPVPEEKAVEGWDFTVEPPRDGVAEEISKVVSPLVSNNLFYRTSASIQAALEHGLRESGAWDGPLEYVVSRYSANDASSGTDAGLRRQAVLHGLRKALAAVNPEAAKSLSNKEIMGSLAYRAALVMHQYIESGFTNDRRSNTASGKAARHASQYQVSAWVLSTNPTAPSEMVTSARDRVAELYNASPSGASKAELKMILGQLDAIYDIVGDPTRMSQFRRDQGMTAFNDVIGTLRAGTKDGGLDEFGNMKDIMPVDVVNPEGDLTDPDNIGTANPKAAEHLRSFLQSHQDPAVQEALKLALTTAYQVAAMAKYYGELDVHPALAGDIAEAKRLARLNGIPENMTSAEFLGEHLVGDSNLVDNPAYVDYQCQSHFIAQNVDAWLRSMVRTDFGAHDGLGQMMSDEHFEYKGLVSAITQRENWIAHMLGVSLEPGGKLLEVIRQKGEYRMEDGEVVRRDGKEYVRFDNYGRKATSVKMDEDDIRRVDMWLKMCSAHANGQRHLVTGVDALTFYRQMSRDAGDYSVEKVVAKRENNERMNPIEWAVWRLTRQVPADLLPAVHRRLVGNMLTAMAKADQMWDRGTPLHEGWTSPAVYDAATYDSYVIGELVRQGVVVGHNPGEARHKGGLPRYENAAVLIPCDEVDANFRGSTTYRKLVDAGRSEEWLDRKFIVDEFMGVWNDAVKFVKRHPWLTHGDGQYFHAFGTALPFWRGSGMFMYNAVRTDRQHRITLSDKMSEAEALVERVTASADAEKPLSRMDPGTIMDDVDSLARFYGIDHRAGRFLQDILDGAYEPGAKASYDSGLVLSADATYGDIAKAIYNRARELVWMSRTGYAGKGHVDLEGIIARYEDTKLQRGEVFGGSMGFRDTDMFRMHGTLPANFQIGHKVHKCIDGITNAMMSRATLANLLLTPEGATGRPVYYADPNVLAAEASGLPDSFWGNLAEWWQAMNPEVGQVYDPARSGVDNARAMYEAIRQKHQIEGKPRKAQIGELGYTELPGDDSQLVSVDRWMVLDGSGEDYMNATAGGEAMGYLKHYLDAGKTLGIGGAATRAAIQRALSYSKSLSVSFSFFFPMATRWESPMGAVGAMSTIGSNWKWVGDWMKEHPDLANKVRGMFGGKAWITHDYIGMKDIVRMMDSNDPFLAEMYSWAAALGISVSTSVTNPMEPDKTVLLKDVKRMKEAIRHSMGAAAAGKFARMMDALLVRQGDKAFNYVLNATKLAVVAQMCMKLRHAAKAAGKAFDPVRDLRRYSRYINAEIGGIDPMQFAWAHPKARALMNSMLFSWQWTVGAWQAGGGSVITDMLSGGHTMSRKEREYFAGRWMRMFLGVMIGVPALFQVVTLALAKALGGSGDDDDRWGTWENEDKTRWTAFDLTPLLKAIARFDETKLGGLARSFKEGGRPLATSLGAIAGGLVGLAGGGNRLTAAIGAAVGAGTGALTPSIVPLYTGRDPANRTTKARHYYMHFGKQGWEFFRWFDDAWAQFNSKLSMPLQRVLEGVVGRSLGYIERSLPWEEQGQFERWLSPTTDSALFNLAEAFLPFSVGGMHRNGDAGALPIFGPVQMGASQTAVQKRLVKALTAWANNDRAGYAYGGFTVKGRKSKRPVNPVADILHDAETNGFDPQQQLNTACGQVLPRLYGRLFELLPEKPGDDYDVREVAKVVRAINRLGTRKVDAVRSLKDKLKAQRKGITDSEMTQVTEAAREGFRDPFGIRKGYDY